MLRRFRRMLRRFRLLLLAPLAALGACAPLPDVAALIASAAGGRAPELIGVHGPHPAQSGHELLQRLLAAGPAPGMLKEHLPVAAAISKAPLAAGNRAMLLTSGPAIERAILDAIANAKDNIDIETYIIADDDAGRRLADLLVRKRAEHVAVNLIYDGLASRDTPPAYFERLRQAGVRTLEFNPINPLAARAAWSPNRRDHRKVFIVDGSVAILGGANVELPAEARNDTWRDTDIRIEGPAVAQCQALFMQTWHAQRGGPVDRADYFPRLQPVGGQVVRVLASDGDTSPIYASLVSAIAAARRSVWLTTPYFAPDAQLLAALKAAAARGVDVRLVLPGRSNVPVAAAAGRAHYQELLDAGVAIYERQHAWLHAKTAVIDGVWSTVGTANLDRRSFLFNHEMNAFVFDGEFARHLEALFESDVARSRRIVSEHWRERGTTERIGEWSADLFSYWW